MAKVREGADVTCGTGIVTGLPNGRFEFIRLMNDGMTEFNGGTDEKVNQILPWGFEGGQNTRIFVAEESDAVENRGYSSAGFATWEVARFKGPCKRKRRTLSL
jgi:hypothetical protein